MDKRVTEPSPAMKKADEKLKKYFRELAGEDMEVKWMELKYILDYAIHNEWVGTDGFSKDMCRSLIALMDTDFCGKMCFEEFKHLWTTLRHWKSVYDNYSQKTQGYLSPFEFQEALNSAGYRLNDNILNLLVLRYAGKDRNICFEDFIMCAVKLSTMIEYFKSRDTADRSKVEFSLDEWVLKTLYS